MGEAKDAAEGPFYHRVRRVAADGEHEAVLGGEAHKERHEGPLGESHFRARHLAFGTVEGKLVWDCCDHQES